MEQPLASMSWQAYSDERSHYSYVRCLSLATAYEVVRVTHDKHGERAEFVHQTIFMNEYSEGDLSDILKGFGYDSLNAFVQAHALRKGLRISASSLTGALSTATALHNIPTICCLQA